MGPCTSWQQTVNNKRSFGHTTSPYIGEIRVRHFQTNVRFQFIQLKSIKDMLLYVFRHDSVFNILNDNLTWYPLIIAVRVVTRIDKALLVHCEQITIEFGD